jgi:hypothetical protein
MDLSLSEDDVLIREMSIRMADQIGLRPAGYPLSTQAAWEVIAAADISGLRRNPREQYSATSCRLVVEAFARRVCAVPYLGNLLGTDLLARAAAQPELPGGAVGVVAGLSSDLLDLGTAGDGCLAVDADVESLVVAREHDGKFGVWGTAPFDGENFDLARGLVVPDISRLFAGNIVIDEQALNSWRAFALCMIAADLTGVAAGALDEAVAYANRRKQFGVTIGSFQAVQHMLAEQYVHLRACQATTQYAAWCIDALATEDALLAAMTAKARAVLAARSIAETLIQVLGGIGMTWESNAHRYLRRAVLSGALLGDEAHQYQSIALARKVRAKNFAEKRP